MSQTRKKGDTHEWHGLKHIFGTSNPYRIRFFIDGVDEFWLLNAFNLKGAAIKTV